MLNVLITRPDNKTKQLALLLKQQGIACVNQPLFDYQVLADYNTTKSLLTSQEILIFVSVAAVEFAAATYPASNWQYNKIYAVGNATKNALQLLGINNVEVPSQENSEGLLALLQLSDHLNDKSVTIVRGNGGREYLADTLIKRGYQVSYLESYQRVWRVLAKDISKQWYQQQINCIVVTSNAILEKLVELSIGQYRESDNHAMIDFWRKQCVWIVVSQRIADKAKAYGISNITISAGASAQAIYQALPLQKS